MMYNLRAVDTEYKIRNQVLLIFRIASNTTYGDIKIYYKLILFLVSLRLK